MIISNNLASLLSDHRTDPASLERAHALAVGLRKSDIPQFKDTLGWVNYRRGEFKEALPLLEDAARSLPDAALIRYHLGMTYLSVGDQAKATEHLQRGLELSKADAETKAKIEAALQKVGKT
jgi:tetratricopeptide (TPR) repeat protein